ncbi:spermidine/putrescine ABC transporter substrate-binding protein [Nocardioides szechwanensis]|uniref:Putative spermidine/putrescine transport system substrate-binding protein n=1 Tax=Nocardioides szechwanensis TaxID=1005944 RepID=A0A1H0KRL8_9ACTN|nr:extracellular solute-binding protein [Nocardioides szechwanensis]GEP35442.1 spermidine/putrescine ABC transporter substrate-binding protein [Nocardioides szechwanensis]SDO58422.1 putative spermidine/putrescine transport system substrate-binding protein [Nocardioides szechwanensis]
MKPTHWRGRVTMACLSVLAVSVLAGCGSDEDKETDAVEELGEMEGQVSILAWPGYVEDGSNDPKVDWVTAFEKDTGCEVTSKVYGTSDEALNLAKTGDYDVIAASGDLSLRLIASDEAQEVNTDLVPNYENVFDFLKDSEWNTVDGVNYGVPHGYGANLLMYNEKNFDSAPTSWGAVFDTEELERNKGKVTAYDSPIYIADAALYLMKTQPDLGIENPYALDEEQLDAAVALLKEQRKYVGEYWSDYLKEIQAFETGDSVVGTTWQVIKNNIKNADVQVTLPTEGATAWNDTWMLSSQSENPNCAYAWMDYILTPKANAQATEYFGEAPNSPAACEETADPNHCETFHAGDEEYAEQLWFWRTPIKECLDGRTDVECTDYAQWTQAWTEIKG